MALSAVSTGPNRGPGAAVGSGGAHDLSQGRKRGQFLGAVLHMQCWWQEGTCALVDGLDAADAIDSSSTRGSSDRGVQEALQRMRLDCLMV